MSNEVVLRVFGRAAQNCCEISCSGNLPGNSQQFSSYLSHTQIAKCKRRQNRSLFANISMNHFSLNAPVAQGALPCAGAWVSICGGSRSSCCCSRQSGNEEWPCLPPSSPDSQPRVLPTQLGRIFSYPTADFAPNSPCLALGDPEPLPSQAPTLSKQSVNKTA